MIPGMSWELEDPGDRLISDFDGHLFIVSLVNPNAEDDCNDEYEDIYVSDPSQGLAGIIFDGDSGPVAYLQGISGLRLLRDINGGLGLPGSTSLGRGSEARELAEQIRKHLNCTA